MMLNMDLEVANSRLLAQTAQMMLILIGQFLAR